MQPLGPIHYPFSYHLTSWFIVRSAPPVTLHLLGFPLRALKQMFFPQHLRQCYLIRSYQIRMPRGIEQACLSEPLLAMVCRHSTVGHLAMLILRKAGRTIPYWRSSSPFIYCMTCYVACQVVLSVVLRLLSSSFVADHHHANYFQLQKYLISLCTSCLIILQNVLYG